MNEQEKKELLIALCGYLPYGVMCNMGLKYPLPLQRIFIDKTVGFLVSDGVLLDFYKDGKDYPCYLSEVKPYLRPMESMTEDEKKILSDIHWNAFEHHWNYVDFCNKHHLDYRGLIQKGLALPAPDGMYDTYKYFPPEFKTYAEYVEHLKSKGLAFDSPNGK